MKKFVRYSLFLLTFLMVASCVLDLLYTVVYIHGAPRNKVMWVKQMQPEQDLDYIILGSSRAKQHIDPIQINDKTNLYGVNFGVEGYGSFEMYLMLQEYLKNKTVRRVFIQVDELYLEAHPHKLSETHWLPFIREPQVYNQFKPFGRNYHYYKYIPFYRYAARDAKLGFRNVITSALGKGQPYESNLGFKPVHRALTTEIPYIPSKPITERNSYIDNIITLCNTKNIELDFFTAPIYKFKGDLSPLKNYLPAYTSFKDSIVPMKLFADQTHLNAAGAKRFTEIFIETYFSEQP